MIIGLTGYARSGKTTAANHLVAEHRYKRKHIATPLRDMLYKLLSAAGYPNGQAYHYLEGQWKDSVIPFFGVSGRHLQVTLGTEWGRNLVSPTIWTDLWEQGVEPTDFVLNDSVRFRNEEYAISDLGGIIIRIDRPGVGPNQFNYGLFGRLMWKWTKIPHFVHPSERISLIEPDYVVVNDGTIEELEAKIDEILVEEWKHRARTPA